MRTNQHILNAFVLNCTTLRQWNFKWGLYDAKVGDGVAGGLGGGDEHEITVARLKHEKAARVQLLHQLDALRANKVRATPGSAAGKNT